MYGEDFLQTAGTNIADTLPSTTVKVVPKTGYTLLAGDFSAITPLPTGISSVNFVQGTGPNPGDQRSLNCTITLDNPLIMPNNNLDLGICISGQGIFKVYDRVVSLVTDLAQRITSSKTGSTHDFSGQYGTTQSLSVRITADSGYYLPVEPKAYINTNATNSYTQNTISYFDSNGYRTHVDINIDYTVVDVDDNTDVITYIAKEVKLIPVAPAVQVNSYSINTSSLTQSGNVREMTVRGIEGASFSVNVVDSGSTSIFSFTGTIPNTGVKSLFIGFPRISTSSETYTVTISGTLNPNLSPTSFNIVQYEDVQVGFSITSANGFTGSSLTPTVDPYYAADTSYNTSFLESYIYQVLIENPTGSLNAQSDVIGFPTSNSFTNIKYNTAGDSEILINSCSFHPHTENGAVSNNKIVMLISYSPVYIGTSDIASTINIDNFLTYN